MAVIIQTDTALLYDAVTLFATALADLDMSQVRRQLSDKMIEL